MSNESRKNELLYRVYAVLFIFFLLVLVIGYRIVKISVVEGETWRAKQQKRHMEWRPLKTQRGNIYADDGVSLLATSVEFFEIRMDPIVPTEKVFWDNIQGLAEGLAEYDNRRSAIEWKDYIVKAREKKNRFLLIAKHVDHLDLRRLQKLPLFKLSRNKGGMIKKRDYTRERPYRDLAARTIGISREKNSVGLENSFHRLLRGEERKAYMKRVAEGLYIPVYDPTDYEIVKGKDLITTIDIKMQDIVHNELLRAVEEHEAEAGTAILMEVKTGRVKAISNLAKSKRTGEFRELQNFGAGVKSEPGSTLKAASVLALLEDGYADSGTVIDFAKGKKKFYGEIMKDSGPHGISRSTLKEAIEISSNVAVASAVDDAYNKTKRWSQYVERLRQFGLADLAGIELEGEPKPYIKHPKKNRADWANTTIPWMSHGYEMEMTPLQILRFYNAIANDGKLVDAQIVKGIASEGVIEREFKPRVKKQRIAKTASIRELQVMLEGVVERGTARKLQSSNCTYAAKTGTTKVGYTTDDPRYNASFVGYWPAEQPKYSMIVVVYGLRGPIYYGNQVAGPVFKRTLDWCYAIDHESEMIAKTEDAFIGEYSGRMHGYGDDFASIFEDIEVSYSKRARWVRGASTGDGVIKDKKSKIQSSIVPDLKGMGLRDAVYVLETLGADVRTEGYGKVVRQSVRPGQKITGSPITVYLN
ncbi:MAG: penicillin-binding protein [Bacteroidota bacterium]